MAKKKDNNEMILVVALIGAVAYFMSNKEGNKPAYNPTANFANEIGPAPAPNTPQWQTWVGAAINLYGAVDDLWEPGGPFHNNNVTQLDLDEYYDEVAVDGGARGGTFPDIFTNGDGTLT